MIGELLGVLRTLPDRSSRTWPQARLQSVGDSTCLCHTIPAEVRKSELIAVAEGLFKGLQGRINSGGIGLDEAEAQILEMTNWIGDAMVQEVVTGLAEPTTANQITVGGRVAVFKRVRNLRFINRLGEEVVRPRPCYRDRDRAGGVAPLEITLGIYGYFGFSPLMTFLICMLGADEAYARAD